MTVPWYEWGPIRERLLIFGRAIQGLSPYRVRLEPDPGKCALGHCDFARHEVVANPVGFPLPPREQYQLTKAILVHEAGHRRFTAPNRLVGAVRLVANILEDERVERLMAAEFAGLAAPLRRLSQELYRLAPPIDASSDSPGVVLGYLLQLRWATRVGEPVKGALSARNQERWARVEPLVYGAWGAEASESVERAAGEVVRLLGLMEDEVPRWVAEMADRLGSVVGEREGGDGAEGGCGGVGESGAEEGDEGVEPEPFDGQIPPNDVRLGRGDWAIAPQPYLWLEEKVEPLVRELVEELAWEESLTQWASQERGGRLSVREYLRDQVRPFLVVEDPHKAPPTLALKVIVDHSTSLNCWSGSQTRMESVAVAVMMLHLVCLELSIPHEVLVTPQSLLVADGATGERGKALIAGLIPALCDYEDMGHALQVHARPMADYPQEIKLVLCLTDGACNDAWLGREVCRALRGKVVVIGVLLDPDEGTCKYVAEMFGADRVIASRPAELPRKLGDVLRALYGV